MGNRRVTSLVAELTFLCERCLEVTPRVNYELNWCWTKSR